MDTSEPAALLDLPPSHDYYQRLHQWIWMYQWQKFCWELQQRDVMQKLHWQQWSAAVQGGSHPHPPFAGIPGGAPMMRMGNAINIPLAAAGHPQIFVGAVGPNNQVDPSWKGFKSAPIWKRITAEVIDILLLMLLKIFLTYMLFDDVFSLDFKKYQDLLDPDNDLRADLAIDLAAELMVVEFAHRLISCFYETVMTVYGFPSAGATYGKWFMGLRIVTCQEFILLDGMILVKPADTPTLKQAATRALLKNYSWAIVVPLPLTVFLNRERRAMYDTACKCMVVEAGDPMIYRLLR